VTATQTATATATVSGDMTNWVIRIYIQDARGRGTCTRSEYISLVFVTLIAF